MGPAQQDCGDIQRLKYLMYTSERTPALHCAARLGTGQAKKKLFEQHAHRGAFSRQLKARLLFHENKQKKT